MDNTIVIDSNMTFEQAIDGSEAPQKVLDQMVLINVKYNGVDGKIHHGQIMVNKDIENLTKQIFYKFLESGFVIEKCIPMSAYYWDDDVAMKDNNSSGFSYGKVAGTNRLNKNSMGFAFDINPLFNPLMLRDGTIVPPEGSYDVERPGTFVAGSDLIKYIESLGFMWGSHLEDADDMHHFEKILECGKR